MRFPNLFLCASIACPNGTYASGNSTGDSTSVCAPCPDVNHVTVKIPATSVLDCSCASGFTANGPKCEGNCRTRALFVHS